MQISLVFVIFALFALSWAAKDANTQEMEQDEAIVDETKLDYAKGSVCGYCEYCKFCQLCEADCPCEKSPSKPNCHMCKYCKFCYLCSGICNTICQPGGILDKVSAAVVNALPSYNKAEIDGDIDGVKGWIDSKKDEL